MKFICPSCSAAIFTPTDSTPSIVQCGNCGHYLHGREEAESLEREPLGGDVLLLPEHLQHLSGHPEEIFLPASAALEALSALAEQGRTPRSLVCFVGNMDRFHSSPQYPELTPPLVARRSQPQTPLEVCERYRVLLTAYLERFTAAPGAEELLVSFELEDAE